MMLEEAYKALPTLMRIIYFKITGRNLSSVFEAGCAAGWFTKYLCECGIDVTAVEGSKHGAEGARRRTGLSENEIIQHDLRRRIHLGKTFDLSFCVELAEHIEPPFSSVLVETLVEHSDLVWFSSTGPGSSSNCDLNHPNEQPLKFWINLFEFFGYEFYRLPDIYPNLFHNRAQLLFYNPKKYASVIWEDVFKVEIQVKF